MAQIYLKKELYDEVVKKGFEVTKFVNSAVEIALKKGETKK
jgi:hypothetical protein